LFRVSKKLKNWQRREQGKMAYLVFIFGFLLSIAGSLAIYFGYGIIEIERGWASVIVGAVFLSGGIITMALAFILRSLSKLYSYLDKEKPFAAPPALPSDLQVKPGLSFGYSEPQPRETPPKPKTGFAAPERALETPNARLQDGDYNIGEIDRESRLRERREPSLPSESDATFAEPKPTPLAWLTEAPQSITEAGEIENSRQAEEQASAEALTDTLEPIPEKTGVAAAGDEPVAPALESQPLRTEAIATADRTIIGHYEADGIAYTMFNDGSIEAKSAKGVLHFASMAELKASIEGKA
jgi:hypothetical protein